MGRDLFDYSRKSGMIVDHRGGPLYHGAGSDRNADSTARDTPNPVVSDRFFGGQRSVRLV